MSRPRKPYGQNPPGRLLGTMIKVLAAEMSDQGRLARGKRYWSDEAVIDIVIGHGAVTAEIQGSRQQPYVVTIEADPGAGVPGKREVWARCTCPDDAGTGVDLCKHAVAALFALADEVTIDPELVDRWRHSARRSRPAAADVDDVDDVDGDDDVDADAPGVTRLPESTRDHDGADDRGSGRDADVIELRPRTDPAADVIAPLLAAPAGATAPTFPDITDFDHGLIRDPLLAEVFDDALDHLAIRWE